MPAGRKGRPTAAGQAGCKGPPYGGGMQRVAADGVSRYTR